MAGSHGEPIGRGWWAQEWEKTPWLLRFFGKPEYRRYVSKAHIGGDFSYWEYSENRASARKAETPKGENDGKA